MAAYVFSEPLMNWYTGMKPFGIWSNHFTYSHQWPHMDPKEGLGISACMRPILATQNSIRIWLGQSWSQMCLRAAEVGTEWHCRAIASQSALLNVHICFDGGMSQTRKTLLAGWDGFSLCAFFPHLPAFGNTTMGMAKAARGVEETETGMPNARCTYRPKI